MYVRGPLSLNVDVKWQKTIDEHSSFSINSQNQIRMAYQQVSHGRARILSNVFITVNVKCRTLITFDENGRYSDKTRRNRIALMALVSTKTIFDYF